jgi:hypothetical protein
MLKTLHPKISEGTAPVLETGLTVSAAMEARTVLRKVKGMGRSLAWVAACAETNGKHPSIMQHACKSGKTLRRPLREAKQTRNASSALAAADGKNPGENDVLVFFVVFSA